MKLPDRNEQIRRFRRRTARKRVFGVTVQIVCRILMIAVTGLCLYLVFWNEDAVEYRGIAAVMLFVLLYGQCASMSMLGLRLFVGRRVHSGSRLTLISVLLCAPLYFTVLLFSLIPLTVSAAFFLTVFPVFVLNTLPMDVIREALSLYGYPKMRFWCVQTAVQLAVAALGQTAGWMLYRYWG